MIFDLAVVGAGPAGLAAAIHASRCGLTTVILERRKGPLDKACGEGLLPLGLRALEALGALQLIDADGSWPFSGIRYVQEDGSCLEARFRGAKGLGIRRTALSAALLSRAGEVGAELRLGWRVTGLHSEDRCAVLETERGPVSARVVVAADGLRSQLRCLAGIAFAHPRHERFGLRRHFTLAPWSPFVEVHWGDGVEAYVTPTGPRRVGLAFLCWRDRFPEGLHFGELVGRFPILRERLAGVLSDSPVLGCGPLGGRAQACVADRLVLLGDAAGAVDPITGEGLSLAFDCAAVLADLLPRAISCGANSASLKPFEHALQAALRSRARPARLLLFLSRRPRLRRRIFARLSESPAMFEPIAAQVMPPSPPIQRAERG